MLKKAWKTLLITSIVTLLPIPVGLILWNRLPDVMATHFGMNNEANGFSSKPFAVFFIPQVLIYIPQHVRCGVSHACHSVLVRDSQRQHE